MEHHSIPVLLQAGNENSRNDFKDPASTDSLDSSNRDCWSLGSEDPAISDRYLTFNRMEELRTRDTKTY